MAYKKSIIRILGSAILTGLLLYAVFSEQGLGEFFSLILNSNRVGIGFYLFLSISALLLRALRYRVVLKELSNESDCPSYSQFLIVTAIRNGFVDLLPARLGEASFFYVCKRYGISLISAASTFGICLALDVVALFFLLIAVFAYSVLSDQSAMFNTLTNDNTVLAISITVFITITAGFVLLKLDRIIGFASKIIKPRDIENCAKLHQKLYAFIKQLSDELATVRQHRRYPLLFSLTVLLRAAKYGGLYVLLVAVLDSQGVGYGDVNPLLTAAAFIGAEASASLPISGLMGFGAYEAAWSIIFSLGNLSISSIPSVIFAVHIITQVVGYSLAALGLAALWLHELSDR